MNRQRLSHQTIIAGLGLLLTVGCTASTTLTPTPIPSTATPIPPTTTPLPPTATPLPPTATPKEKYEEVDPSELNIVFEGSLQSFEMDSAGNVIAVEGTVTRITVGGKSIALSSNKILLEDKEAFIVTRDYGKIKVTFDSFGRVILWLKPSQKEKLKELLK